MNVTDRYRTTGDLPSAIPVFPLQGCILLPRATLSLNIFEPRYLAMINDVLSHDRIVGIVQPSTEAGRSESPAGKAVPLRTVGCAGRLTGFEELPDGRMSIMLTGIARFSVVGEITTITPYRQVEADFERFVGDLVTGAGEDDINREQLLDALRRYLEAKRLQADWKAIEETGSELLINALSLTSPYDPEEKQALLEAPTLKDRAQVLLALSQMELAAGLGGDVHRRMQ